MNNLSFVNAYDKDFIEKLKEIVLSNLSDENFGVEELVAKSGLSSSIVRHRIKIITQKTISQFINEVRLNKALEILRNDSLTASEVAYQVGFSSPAYFNNCFHDYYGYPPGEAKKRLTLIQENHKTGNTTQTDDSFKNKKHPKRKIRQKIFKPATIIAVIGILLWLVYLTFYDSSFQVLGKKLSKEEKSIAVLPFENLSNGDENQHFAKGVTDKILSNLSQISEITVISDPVKVNAENLKNFEKIAHKSGIRFILTGSVQRSGDSIQIIPKLIDLNNNQLKWSDTYSEEWSNIFQVQSKIAIQVASELHAIISKNEKAQIEKIPTTSQEAYNYYLTGRFLLENRPNRDEDTNRYLTPFKKAISADNNFAEAYAGLADVYLTITGIQCYPQPQGFNLAKKYIQRALELNPDLAEVHFTLGRIYRYEWRWEEARKELEISMKLNPQNADFCNNYAQLMYYFRNYEAYKFYTIKAAELNPVSSKLILSKAYMYGRRGILKKRWKIITDILKSIRMFTVVITIYGNCTERQARIPRLLKCCKKHTLYFLLIEFFLNQYPLFSKRKD